MFRTNQPVTADAFFDREAELERLTSAVQALEAGTPQWLALIGPRKIGKTSLLMELQRRCGDRDVAFVVLDSYEDRPLSLALFRRLALRTIDAFLAREAGVSFESLFRVPGDYRAALGGSPHLARLDQTLRRDLLELDQFALDRSLVEFALDLPQRLASALGRPCIVAWDEFQELADLATGRTKTDVYALARARWQRHDRVGYLISGSRRSMMTELVASPASPFFQHFAVLDIGPLPAEQSMELLRGCAPEDRHIPEELAQRATTLLGGHPFYLQLFGDALTREAPPYGEPAYKGAVGELLFSRTGRLSLYFRREHDQAVGRARTLETTLRLLAHGPHTLSELARASGASAPSVSRYLDRLDGVVQRADDGRYEIADPVYALWLRWAQPGGTAVPMSVIGDEAELAVARTLATMGFELVYQSRASRGAFDLLGVRAGQQLGLQVKRSALPLRFSKSEWQRLEADARRFRWRHVVAAVDPNGQVRFLDPGGARVARAVTLGDEAKIDNLLAWLG